MLVAENPSEWSHAPGRRHEIANVTTVRPWGLASIEGQTQFFVRAIDIIDV
jgi:hypothetical protein